MVFSACNGIVFVVIEIGSGEEQHFRLRGKNAAEGPADRNQLVKRQGANGDGNERESGAQNLQKRKLDLKRVFALVSDRVFGKKRASSRDLHCQFRVYCRVAQWSPPRALAQDGGFRSLGKMPNTQNDDARRKGDTLVNGGRDMA